MATVTKYVDPDAGGGGTGVDWANAYTSLSAWDAAEQTNLVTDGDTHVCYVRSSSGTDDTTEFDVDGWTTGSGNEIKIECQAADRHAGVWNDSKYVLQGSNSATNYTIVENYVTIIGLQYEHVTGNNAAASFEVTGTNCLIDKCIFKMTSGVNNDGVAMRGSSTGQVRNSLFYDFDDDHLSAQSAATAPSWYFYNCTSVNCAEDSFDSAYNDTEAYNCCAFDAADAFNGTFNAADYNAYDEGADPGTNGVDISAVAGTDLFLDYNNDDFHVKDTNSALYDAAGDQSGVFTDDIDGDTRSQWDIGADEYVTVTAGIVQHSTVLAQRRRILGSGSNSGLPILFKKLKDWLHDTFKIQYIGRNCRWAYN